MTELRDIAHAKLNLTLEVLGRRGDDYHELRSLVAFTELGDPLAFEPEGDLALVIEGPFAGVLQGSNLITAAAEAAKTLVPGVALGRFRLDKRLPVAAGLGGGSADAAAALRLLARANPGQLSVAALEDLAAALGSDVTACLENRPALMTGRGARLTPAEGLPSCGVLLVKPGGPLASGAVYGALGAPPLSERRSEPPAIPGFAGNFDALVDYADARANDLEPAALKLAPEIADVLAALKGLDGARLVRLSGSGPTCFALFATEDEARRAAATMATARPSWWVAPTRLLPGSD
jgi:4-diphosphocytidyl-2-C-methyl-D-erythritol kinase